MGVAQFPRVISPKQCREILTTHHASMIKITAAVGVSQSAAVCRSLQGLCGPGRGHALYSLFMTSLYT